MATALLLQSILDSLGLQVGELNPTEKVWESIKVKHVGVERVREARLQILMAEFDRLTMKETKNIEDSKLVKKFIKNLKTTSYEDIVGRLKVYEELIYDEEESHEDQCKLMFTSADSRNYSNQDFNGDYKGKRLGGKNVLTEERVVDGTNCVPSKFEINLDKENVWYLGNGSSNHRTGDRKYFDQLDEKITGKVRFGDDSRVDIKGKDTIAFVDLNGTSRTMIDVYYIPRTVKWSSDHGLSPVHNIMDSPWSARKENGLNGLKTNYVHGFNGLAHTVYGWPIKFLNTSIFFSSLSLGDEAPSLSFSLRPLSQLLLRLQLSLRRENTSSNVLFSLPTPFSCLMSSPSPRRRVAIHGIIGFTRLAIKHWQIIFRHFLIPKSKLNSFDELIFYVSPQVCHFMTYFLQF
ncbi:hypothetical protein ISN44_As02g007420 [Arabidopsis suecica]|uniref:Retrovirus-related Pol polyprotein from transposon TNT 1-94-like beta-barrel domain-containing protein n=1 Tax=Arabidopsis suecica TaxID=45249 RepID=A0A8T2FWP3_ARASU|nr:hypothetical protein ISN44_As02g007420 [Arabidopsis suecica]